MFGWQVDNVRMEREEGKQGRGKRKERGHMRDGEAGLESILC